MHAYDLFRWALAGLLGFLGCWIIAANYAGVILAYTRRRNYSMVPFLGGFLACFGILACPVRAIERFAWVPFVVDLGCVALLVSSIVHLAVVMPVSAIRKARRERKGG